VYKNTIEKWKTQ